MDAAVVEREAPIVSLASDILSVVFGNFSHFTDMCASSLVCSNWKQVADEHPKWNLFLQQQMQHKSSLPKRVSMAPAKDTPAAPGPSSPAAQVQPQQQGKAGFKAWWTEHVNLRCLEPLLGSAVVRKRSAAAWATYSAKEQLQGVPYPLAVKNLLSIGSIGLLLLGVSATNNYLEIGGKVWRAPLPLRHVGQHVMRIINENQGCCYWYVLFNEGEEDPPVYLSESVIHEGQLAASSSDDSPSADERKAGEEVEGEPDEEEKQDEREEQDEQDEHDEQDEEDEEEEEVQDFILQSSSFSKFWEDYIREGLDWHKQSGGEYLDDDLRQALQGVHPWMRLPDGEGGTDGDEPPPSDGAGRATP